MKPFAITAILFSLLNFQAFGQQQAQSQKAPSPGITPTAPPTPGGDDALLSTCTYTDQGVQKPGVFLLYESAAAVGKPASFSLVCSPTPQQSYVRAPFTHVWTAKDAQAQFDFLRAEIKSTIENAVNDKLVNSATIQDAVSQSLQDDKRLKAAVAEELKNQMDAIENNIVTAVLEKLKNQQTNSQTTQAKKPQ